MSAAQAGMGESYQMLAIASVVIGGTSMSGGEGDIPGTVVGALILTLIVNGMNLLGLPTNAQALITGVVIIWAVLMDTQMKKIRFIPKAVFQKEKGSEQ
jgi:ribose/xylose/arabinose/galactoside ABC-type transport system permease subunit